MTRLTITRHYTQAGHSPFAAMTFEQRSSKIVNPDGTVVFSADDLEIPHGWDQTAVDIVASKYFRKAGVPLLDTEGTPIVDADGNPVTGGETSVKQWASRLAAAWRLWGEKNDYFATSEDAQAFEDETAYIVANQIASPNSPQHFNTGLYEAYGIVNDPNGEWYVDPATGEVKESEHRYQRSSANACFIQSVADRLVGDNSIFDLMEREARLFQAGSGSGTNFSTIRAKGEKLSGGGRSSGLMSFLKVSDRAAGGIKSGGTTRRAAKMVIVDDDHPEVFDFIWAKAKEEDKIAALAKAGWSSAWNAEDGAVEAAFYQNFNGSIMLSSAFMQAVANDTPWELRARTTGEVMTTVNARDMFHQIAAAAHRCADPGVMYRDIINDWNTVANDGTIVATNPCAEYVFLNDTACNLASINLLKFYDDTTSTFDIDKFNHVVRLFQIMLEITVSMSHYPSAEIAANSYRYRTTGLGYCNLGALLMRSGLPYDSPAARSVMGAVTALMHLGAYNTSTELAVAVGPAPGYHDNSDHLLRVIRNHIRAADGTDSPFGEFEQLGVIPQTLDHQQLAATPFASLSDEIHRHASALWDNAPQHGVRNMFVTCIAPTGTIGLQMGADTTGIEPAFALVVGKKLAGGGYMKIVNESVEPALASLGYSPQQRREILRWALGTGTLHGDTPVSARTLAERGLSAESIMAIEAALASSFDLEFAATVWNITATDRTRLGLDDVTGSILTALGFTSDDIATSNTDICGHHTLDGAPYLHTYDLAVFDCANYCGTSPRVISWEGHLRALGAVAPFVSGSISKTVNMPHDATIDDIASAYLQAMHLGVKNVAIYRDGSKGSQVLSSGSLADGAVDTTTENPLSFDLSEIRPGMSPIEFYRGATPPRFRPPNPRFGATWRIEVGGEELYLRVNTYADGTPAELFVDWGRQGSTLRGITSALSIAISHALQRGMPLEELVRAFRGQTFEPNGIVSGHDNLKMASSVVDAIARVLGHYFLGRDDLVQVPSVREPDPDSSTPDIIKVETVPDVTTSVTDIVTTGERIYGESCPSCGSARLRQTGSCRVCMDCFETTGCS